MTTDPTTPNPGSDAAIALGCTCPVLDNGHGHGCGRKGADGQPLFWIRGGCPVHRPQPTKEQQL
jgi:hypothetical protein